MGWIVALLRIHPTLFLEIKLIQLTGWVVMSLQIYLSQVMNRNNEILALSKLAQSLIEQLYARNPCDETFAQAGITCGQETVEGYIHHDEPILALEHLLYIIYESNICFPTEMLHLLHQIAKEYGVATRYY
jgi:hypothetical protein